MDAVLQTYPEMEYGLYPAKNIRYWNCGMLDWNF